MSLADCTVAQREYASLLPRLKLQRNAVDEREFIRSISHTKSGKAEKNVDVRNTRGDSEIRLISPGGHNFVESNEIERHGRTDGGRSSALDATWRACAARRHTDRIGT